ncbi:MAG: Sua5/YciO/YrdC/YwlC family protein, partial [Deltaproteobacteria bacterium]|nr:Sua5/YciO/YrdC/YwlC family protein [Deltaproteobacteria bacterium]
HPGQHPALIGPRDTVGLRVEGLPVIRTLVRALDRAVTGPSANPAGAPPALTADEVADYFGDGVDLILDGGPCPGGKPSTLIDTSTTPPRLLRDGPLNLDNLLAVVPDMRT